MAVQFKKKGVGIFKLNSTPLCLIYFRPEILRLKTGVTIFKTCLFHLNNIVLKSGKNEICEE